MIVKQTQSQMHHRRKLKPKRWKMPGVPSGTLCTIMPGAWGYGSRKIVSCALIGSSMRQFSRLSSLGHAKMHHIML